MIRYRNAVLVPFDDIAIFPSRVMCGCCDGVGGFDDQPRHGGDPMEPDDYYWNGCNHCDEQGYFFNPTTKVVRRFMFKLHWRNHETHSPGTMASDTGQIQDNRQNVPDDRNPS